MKVNYTIEFPDHYRRAINFVLGKPGKASRDECIAHIEMMLDADAAELCSEMRAHIEGKQLTKERG